MVCVTIHTFYTIGSLLNPEHCTVYLFLWLTLFSMLHPPSNWAISHLFTHSINVKVMYVSISISHHHVMPQVRISLTLFRHFSLLFIASGRSSGPHPISSHSCWMYVWTGRPAFAQTSVGVHRSTSLMSVSLLLQQWPACLVRLTY